MNCTLHGKEVIGRCQWCGKAICRYCEYRTDGKKMYCKDCSSRLAKIPPARLPVVGRQVGKSPVKKSDEDSKPKIVPYYD